MQIFDVVVIGNGALGIATAVELQASGKKTALVGPDSRQFSASTAAGAMNGCFGEVTSSLLSSKFGRMKLDWDFCARDLWDEWVEKICEGTEADPGKVRNKTGTTVMLNPIGTSAVDSGNFSAILQALDEYSEEHDVLEYDQIKWINPQETCRPFKAIHIPNEHSINTKLYFSLIENHFQRLGGRQFNALATGIGVQTSGSVESVHLSDGTELHAKAVVISSGANIEKLVGDCIGSDKKLIPPVISGYGVGLLLNTTRDQALGPVMRTPNRAFACGLHAVPRGDSQIYVGATNILSAKRRENADLSDLHFLIDCALNQLRMDFRSASVDRIVVGNRPVPIDGYPLIGALRDSGVWLATGTYRDGFHQSPFLAKKIAAEIATEAPGSDLPEEFAPIRAPISERSRGEVIQEAVDHMLATGYEYNWKVPVDWPERIRKHLVAKYEKYAAELNYKFTPPADVLVSSVGNPSIEDPLAAYYAAHS